MRPTHVVPDRGAPVTRIGLGRPTSGEVTTAARPAAASATSS